MHTVHLPDQRRGQSALDVTHDRFAPTATGVVAVSDEHVVKLRDHLEIRRIVRRRGVLWADIASGNATALAFLGATASVLGIFVFQRRLLLGAELQLADVELFLQALL
jgi:hypothetical protein